MCVPARVGGGAEGEGEGEGDSQAGAVLSTVPTQGSISGPEIMT